MKLTKKFQYALLFVLYLTRAGQASAKTVSENLNIPHNILCQLTLRMKRNGILKRSRGRHGVYELAMRPTVADVAQAVAPIALKGIILAGGPVEHRVLTQYACSMQSGMRRLLNRPVENLIKELTANELTTMNNLRSDSQIN